MTYGFRSDSVHSCRLAWQISLLLFVFCGCGHHEDDEDHHLEHLIPDHKPASFAEAVPELSTRGLAVLTGQAASEARQQLLDIIDWLPELAADSDLGRKQWEQARDTGIELRRILTNPTAETSQPQWNQLVDELAALVSASDTWSQRTHTDDNSPSTPPDGDSSTSEFAAEVHDD